MTFTLIANLVLMTTIVVAIVGLLAGAIWTSRAQPAARRTGRVARRSALSRAYASYQGVNA
jgi:FtsZ-interacting cell division protein ZipA